MHIGLNIPFQKLRAAGGVPKVFYHYSIGVDEIDYFESFIKQNRTVLDRILFRQDNLQTLQFKPKLTKIPFGIMPKRCVSDSQKIHY